MGAGATLAPLRPPRCMLCCDVTCPGTSLSGSCVCSRPASASRSPSPPLAPPEPRRDRAAGSRELEPGGVSGAPSAVPRRVKSFAPAELVPGWRGPLSVGLPGPTPEPGWARSCPALYEKGWMALALAAAAPGGVVGPSPRSWARDGGVKTATRCGVGPMLSSPVKLARAWAAFAATEGVKARPSGRCQSSAGLRAFPRSAPRVVPPACCCAAPPRADGSPAAAASGSGATAPATSERDDVCMSWLFAASGSPSSCSLCDADCAARPFS